MMHVETTDAPSACRRERSESLIGVLSGLRRTEHGSLDGATELPFFSAPLRNLGDRTAARDVR
jgi:hypothetical protein